MSFTSSTAELFSSYRYREDANTVEYDDMEVVSESSESDTDQDDDSYNQESDTNADSEESEQDTNQYPSTANSNYHYNKPILHITEICEDGSSDWSLFVRYEQEDVYIVYGLRKSRPNDVSRSRYNPIRLKFLGRDSLLAFFRHAFCSVSSKLNVTMYNMKFNDNTYEGTYQYYVNLMQNSKYNELFGYDGLDMNPDALNDYLSFIRYAWN